MKKIHNIFLILILVSLWTITILSNRNVTNDAIEYEKIADRYYENNLYSDALNNYEKSLSIDKRDSVKNKIVNTLILDQKYEEAFNKLHDLKISDEGTINYQNKILDILIQKEEYRLANKLSNISKNEVKESYKNKYYSEYYIYDNEYDSIKHNPNEKNIIVSINNKYFFINSKNRIISKKFNNILGKDENFQTVVDDEKNKVIDINGNVRSNLYLDIVGYYKNNYLVAKDNNRFYYIDRVNNINSKAYEKASNFTHGKAIVKESKVKIIDSKFKEIKKFDATDFKIDSKNDAIYDDKIILKNQKYQIYDIKKDKYSKQYDDIDFSYGEYIAVRENDKWGYINQDFEIIKTPKYDYAYSYSQAMGIVKENSEYKILDKNFKEKKKIINEILPFNNEGISFIKHSDKWKMIRLVRYIND